jgi:hypothetical protein
LEGDVRSENPELQCVKAIAKGGISSSSTKSLVRINFPVVMSYPIVVINSLHIPTREGSG